ncbi:MAG: 5'-nucleotidase [Planctomycetota bacterium]|nr:MAG: 5'-nucleotidase [Planctomycetota bacterium]
MDLSGCLVIGVSSRALFDLEDEDRIYRERGLRAYSHHQIDREEQALKPGAGFPLVEAMLRLNPTAEESRVCEVILMSRNNADASLRLFRSFEAHGLDVTRAALTSGAPLAPYLKAFEVDLFLSRESEDVQAAIQAGVAAAQIFPSPEDLHNPLDEIRIAFDGDAVLFSDESERIFKEKGLKAFQEHEKANARNPMAEGPFAKLLRTLSFLQQNVQPGRPRIRTALVTARNSPSHERVIRTLRTWGVRIDEAFFMGGVGKREILKAFSPHVFFDDQEIHVKPASEVVPAGLVPYLKNGKAPSRDSQKETAG